MRTALMWRRRDVRALCDCVCVANISRVSHNLTFPPTHLQNNCHKLKRLVQKPNSFFMDVKCPGCFQITTMFSHAATVVFCASCATVLCQVTLRVQMRVRFLSCSRPSPSLPCILLCLSLLSVYPTRSATYALPSLC